MARLKRKGWRWWALAVLVLFVVEEAARALLSDSALNALTMLGEGLRWLSQQPVGYAGLFLVGYIVLLLGLSWWETRPKSESEPQEPAAPPLSRDEREAIHHIRVLWNRYGERAALALLKLFGDVVSALPSTVYWVDLLKPKHPELERARNGLSQALREEEQRSLQEVISRFNEFYIVYVQVCSWLARLEHNEDVRLEDLEWDRLGWWKYHHCLFRDKLWDEHERRAFKGKLKIRHEIYNKVVADFLLAAETKPCKQHNPTPSDQNNEVDESSGPE